MVHRAAPMGNRVIGVIGGSGIYDLDGLRDVEEVRVDTPFGPPSDALIRGRLGDAEVVFLSRHGRGHTVLPHEVNYRANVFAMKTLGVEWLLSLSAVGSMRVDIRPGDLVVVDQYFDRTDGRASTFFGEGVAAHVSFGDPVSPVLAGLLHEAAVDRVKAGGGGERVHRGGTYMVINGPQFSTRAESNLYRQWGCDVIGMTNMPEAKLAREAEICYATVAMVTDYDCWHDDHAEVDVAAVIKVLRANVEKAERLITRLARSFPREHPRCPIGSDRALEVALITPPEARDPAVLAKLDAVAGRVLGKA